jgi:hypothetical protein
MLLMCSARDDRAMVMKRYPNGAAVISSMKAPSPKPEWIETSIEHSSGNAMISNRADLPSLLGDKLGCIDLNQWYAR